MRAYSLRQQEGIMNALEAVQTIYFKHQSFMTGGSLAAGLL